LQINVADERRTPLLQKPLENHFTLSITHRLGDFIAVLRKKAALIMYAALLLVIAAGCGGGEGITVSSTQIGQTGGTSVTGSIAGTTDYVSGAFTGSATLAWDAPVTNTDGTPLTDLAGYKIYFGASSGNYTSVIDVGNVTKYTVTNLSSGTYYFAVVSYDIAGIESDYSNEAGKTIQ
jgi:hypothetical protein